MNKPAETHHIPEDVSSGKGPDIITKDVEENIVPGQDTETMIENTVTPHARLMIRKNFSRDTVPDSVKEKIVFTATNLATKEAQTIFHRDFREDGTYYTLYSLEDR